MKFKGKVFILNKPFEGSYTDVEGNVAHEIIDYFKADNNKVYIYNNPWGHCPDNIEVDESKNYKVEFMFLAKKATMNKKGESPKWSEFELTHLIKIKKCLHHESTHDDIDELKAAQSIVKNVIDDEGIEYAGKSIYEIYGDEDASLYVTFEAEKIYEAKSPIRVKTTGYRFQRNKGYVFSDENGEAFSALEQYTDLKYWRDITNEMTRVDVKNFKPNQNKTFLDLILKVDSEECYTNMLYMVLGWKNTMNLFAKEFAKGKKIDLTPFSVHRELKIPKSEKIKGGRTDVCAYNNNQRIVIENKVFSGLNGIDDTNKTTQLTIYYNWAKQPGQLEPLCFISCPDYRKTEIEAEIEIGMKGKYQFVEYSKISKFIEALNKKNHFKGFSFEGYIQDIINAFDKFGYQSKSKLFEQFFLEAIQKTNP